MTNKQLSINQLIKLISTSYKQHRHCRKLKQFSQLKTGVHLAEIISHIFHRLQQQQQQHIQQQQKYINTDGLLSNIQVSNLTLQKCINNLIVIINVLNRQIYKLLSITNLANMINREVLSQLKSIKAQNLYYKQKQLKYFMNCILLPLHYCQYNNGNKYNNNIIQPTYSSTSHLINQKYPITASGSITLPLTDNNNNNIHNNIYNNIHTSNLYNNENINNISQLSQIAIANNNNSNNLSMMVLNDNNSNIINNRNININKNNNGDSSINSRNDINNSRNNSNNSRNKTINSNRQNKRNNTINNSRCFNNNNSNNNNNTVKDFGYYYSLEQPNISHRKTTQQIQQNTNNINNIRNNNKSNTKSNNPNSNTNNNYYYSTNKKKTFQTTQNDIAINQIQANTHNNQQQQQQQQLLTYNHKLLNNWLLNKLYDYNIPKSINKQQQQHQQQQQQSSQSQSQIQYDILQQEQSDQILGMLINKLFCQSRLVDVIIKDAHFELGSIFIYRKCLSFILQNQLADRVPKQNAMNMLTRIQRNQVIRQSQFWLVIHDLYQYYIKNNKNNSNRTKRNNNRNNSNSNSNNKQNNKNENNININVNVNSTNANIKRVPSLSSCKTVNSLKKSEGTNKNVNTNTTVNIKNKLLHKYNSKFIKQTQQWIAGQLGYQHSLNKSKNMNNKNNKSIQYILTNPLLNGSLVSSIIMRLKVGRINVIKNTTKIEQVQSNWQQIAKVCVLRGYQCFKLLPYILETTQYWLYIGVIGDFKQEYDKNNYNSTNNINNNNINSNKNENESNKIITNTKQTPNQQYNSSQFNNNSQHINQIYQWLLKQKLIYSSQQQQQSQYQNNNNRTLLIISHNKNIHIPQLTTISKKLLPNLNIYRQTTKRIQQNNLDKILNQLRRLGFSQYYHITAKKIIKQEQQLILLINQQKYESDQLKCHSKNQKQNKYHNKIGNYFQSNIKWKILRDLMWIYNGKVQYIGQ